MQKITVVAVASFVALAGCKQEELGKATYDPPDTSEARTAVLAALRIDAIERPHRRAAILARKRKTISRDAVVTEQDMKLSPHRIRTLRRNKRMAREMSAIKKIKCNWTRLPYKKISGEVKLRIGKAPVGAYKCAYDQVFNRKYAIPSLQNPQVTGYFYKNKDGEFTYVGRFRNPYP